MDQITEYLKGCIYPIILGVFGGFVSLISGDKVLTMRYFFGGILLSIFVVLILDAAMKDLHASTNTWAITMYMGGYCSRKVVELIEKQFLASVKSRVHDDSKLE